MIYSMVPAVVLIINLILNGESLLKYGFLEKKQGESDLVHVRYNHFVLAACCYFFVDGSWGILYEYHDIPQLFPAIYSFTVFYFVLMLLTMLTWTRYIIAYLDKHGRRTKVLLYGVWGMVVIGIACLLINQFFDHFMFSYNEAHEFIGESGSNISYLLQIAFYAVITVYMVRLAIKSTGQEKFRYSAVAATSVVLGVFQILQINYAFLPFYAMGLMIGICLVLSFVQSGEKREKEIHDNIANAMAQDYEAIFYIEIETGEFISFSKSQKYMSLNASESGKDFFKETLENIENCVYPEDREYAKSFYSREEMLRRLEDRHSFSFKYRIMFDGKPRFFLFTVSRDINERYLIFYEKDIDDELNAEKIQKENQKKTVTFGQIAESLASNYDAIYYVNVADSAYVGYEVNNIYGQLEISKSGEDFFKESLDNIPNIVHRQDRDQVAEFIGRDSLLTALEDHKDCSLDYRIMVNGKARYTRMIARKSSDGTHLIIGVEDIDEMIKREKRHMKALKTEKELARRDELTGVRNKTAYKELEKSLQSNIDNGMDYLNFALVVCDSNNLKMINDTLGHAAGDEYIKASAQILCDTFVHSPVFRVGGDEFVVFLRGSDYLSRKELIEKLRSKVIENMKNGDGVVLASGMAEYQPEIDSFVSDIFERADKDMYANKESLKS